MKAVLNLFRQRPWKLHLSVILAGLGLDQLTKYLAVKAYSLPGGHINPFAVTEVIGEWLRFRLVYNPGAAFGLQPQKLLPWLHPTVFYVLISILAMVALLVYYTKTPKEDRFSLLGLAFILSGALGNLFDRFRIHKVVDFIDVGIPGYNYRWPTFNIADSMVCIGVGILLIMQFFSKPPLPQNNQTASGSVDA